MTATPPEPHPTLIGTEWTLAAARTPGRVSVIIPSYNHARFIAQAIRSVALQTHPDVELIVVDDGSTDESLRVILEALERYGIGDAILEVQENSGTGTAINRGLMRSSGEYVCVLNSDDYYHPGRIAALVQAMSESGSEFAFSEVKHVDRVGRPAEQTDRGRMYQAWLNEVDTQPTTGFALLRWNGMASSSNLMVAASLVERVGLFSGLRLASDWEYALRALAETEPVLVRQPLLYYRLHPAGTISALGFSWADLRAEFNQLLATYFELVVSRTPTNKLAPGPTAWPDAFEAFLRSDDYISRWQVGAPTLWDAWIAWDGSAAGSLIPPAELMTLVGSVGAADFRAVSQEFRFRMVMAGLRPDHDILDIGCGSGRIALGLAGYVTDEGSYTGFDVVEEAIEWCRREITPRYPNFTFELADVRSGFYRPQGGVEASAHRFPYADESFDFAALTSVFTHMLPDGVDAYAAEIARVLRPGGRTLATFFLGNDESYDALAANKARIPFETDHGVYRTLREGPLEFAVCHDEENILSVLRRHGLRVAEPIQYGTWANPDSANSLQDIVVLEREPSRRAPEPSGLQIVAVTHRPAIFERYVGTNEHVRRHPVVRYDNTVENVPVPIRYNHFIDHHMGDGWVAFIHHDFSFDADPLPALEQLSPDHIYGVVGAELVDEGRYAFVRTPGGASRRAAVRWSRGRARRVVSRGGVKCSLELAGDGFVGHPVTQPYKVDTLDCCCLIVHSSLIREHDLRFDERFDWHLYAEDFSLTARARGVDTYVVPIDAGHYGTSTIEADDFKALLPALLEKHGPDFASTCYYPESVGFYASLQESRGWMLRY